MKIKFKHLQSPGTHDKRAIFAATRVRIFVASSRAGRGIAGDPLGQNEFL